MASRKALLALAMAAALFAVACAVKPTFTVQPGSTTKKLGVKVNKPGHSVAEVELRQHGSETWLTMKKTGPDTFTVQSPTPLKGPYNFRIVTEKGLRGVFDDVVPETFKCGTTYVPDEY
ncbi:hypothetical protein BRADI_4g00350v3 [Brachypodium distachyon]|uniref:Expansin-like CBD domain-containing protein n=2 Tax=Brachypodium distachyon TaxID=15368 RepID=I1IG02_BRADI|nr:hypothetical protein BRADI_4g00350v3 [Brachypodium distachyon]